MFTSHCTKGTTFGGCGIVQKEEIFIMCDNQGCIVFVKKSTHYFRTKYIDVHHCFIGEKLDIYMLKVLSNRRYDGGRACKNTCKMKGIKH